MPSWTLWALLGFLLWVLFLLVVLRVLALTGRSARETAPARRRQPVEPLDVQERDRPFATAEGRRILVVDDDPSIRRMLERTLKAEGYDTRTASDGGAALATAESWPPHAIVLDVVMPGIDGHAVARRLRHKGDAVPILLLTARDEVSDRVAGLDAGADDYLVKPFAPDELAARLRALLRR